MIDGKSHVLGHGFIPMGKWFQPLKVDMNESYISALLEVFHITAGSNLFGESANVTVLLVCPC